MSTQTTEPTQAPSALRRFFSGGVGRNAGLVLALIVLFVVGAITGGENFANFDNMLVVLRQASVLGVVAVGMTFVILTAGIDLSVGAVLALASVVATIAAVQDIVAQSHWIVMVVLALATGAAAGLVNGVVIAYGKVVAFIATLAMMVGARGLAEVISDNGTLIIRDQDFVRAMNVDILGVDLSIWIFALVAVAGWVVLNRTTFGRRTIAIGGNLEAARLSGIKVKRHTMWIYTIAGLCVGIGTVLMIARTTAGTSTHGTLLELDAIAAVVVGGTLLSGGRGTMVGTVFGVLIFSLLTNVFVQNNLPSSTQSVVKGIIIVVAVLLQQRFASRPGR
ncbi:sugar ABC transporter permease [Microbacterium faecale]|uniref:Sugar ABC transporter permease n=1 Tax=Microbacterium faecale TaxID=1804630 RepID=A0A916YHW6_9MICO|nr:ABC transporter permease [Microbacterium faecale]GGD46034.1 sugar ABC transporter permease [Microbacterium faecale]